MPVPLHPHAVKSAGVMQFAHDAVGNQIERPGESITYTDWDLPRQYIPKGGGISTTFEYSGTGQRVRRILGETEIVYLGDLYEQETNGNTVTKRFYVHNDERVVAMVERSPSGEAWSFVHADHLGSVDVISNEAGEEIDRRSFDAWGAPRDPKWGSNGPASQNAIPRRGFTWHEGDDDVGLINAKGRIYDPNIARFLQADPSRCRDRIGEQSPPSAPSIVTTDPATCWPQPDTSSHPLKSVLRTSREVFSPLQNPRCFNRTTLFTLPDKPSERRNGSSEVVRNVVGTTGRLV